MILGRTFYCLLLNGKRQQQQHGHCHLVLLIAFLEGTVTGNIMLLCVNYTVTIWTDSNDGMTDDDCGRIQEPILLFKTATGTRKDFFQIYRQFGRAPFKRLHSPMPEKFRRRTLRYGGWRLCTLQQANSKRLSNPHKLKSNAAVLVPSSLVAIPRTDSSDTNISTQHIYTPLMLLAVNSDCAPIRHLQAVFITDVRCSQ